MIDGVIEFLSGETQPIQRDLERRMQEAAADERFEDAARYRNRLFAIRHLAERQAADQRAVGTVDVIGIAIDGDRAAVQIFPLRDGKLVDRYAFHLENAAGEDTAAVLEALLPRVLRLGAERPPAARRPPRRGRHRRAGAVPVRPARVARRGARPGAGREAPAAGARRPERAARARVGPAPVGAAAAAPGRGARGAARGAQPREPADPDRVLRHLEHPGRVAGRLDGRLPGRRAEEGPLPQVRRRPARGARRLRRDRARSSPAASPGSATSPRTTTTSRSRPCRTWS